MTTAAEKGLDSQVVTHHVGDVTCILMVPAGCPVPHVALTVHAHATTPDERAAAVGALELWCPTKRSNDTHWREREADGYRATVFLLADDPDAQVIA